MPGPGLSPTWCCASKRARCEHERERGDLDEVRPWASISKLAVGLAFGVEMDWGFHAYGDIVGPHGANVANLSVALERPRSRRG